MKFGEALNQLLADGNLSVEPTRYHLSDQMGGRDTDWSDMSIYSDEGKLLYSLIRRLRPTRVMEIGVFTGCSTCHILQALHDNRHGHLFSVDINPQAGNRVPMDLRVNWTLITGDATTIELPKYCDIVFEDSVHELEGARRVFQNILRSDPRLVIAHDACMHEVYPTGFAVSQAFNYVFGDNRIIKLDRTITGLIYSWRK